VRPAIVSDGDGKFNLTSSALPTGGACGRRKLCVSIFLFVIGFGLVELAIPQLEHHPTKDADLNRQSSFEVVSVWRQTEFCSDHAPVGWLAYAVQTFAKGCASDSFAQFARPAAALPTCAYPDALPI